VLIGLHSRVVAVASHDFYVRMHGFRVRPTPELARSLAGSSSAFLTVNLRGKVFSTCRQGLRVDVLVGVRCGDGGTVGCCEE
jgi:hypothetical protein